MAALARHKNIDLPQSDHPALVRHALENLPRAVMRRVVEGGDRDADLVVTMRVNRSLDLFAAIQLAYGFMWVEGKVGPFEAVLEIAEKSLETSANDDAPVLIRKWDHPVAMVEKHYAAMGRSCSPFTLPDTASVLSVMQLARPS
jgi:hypothetical protein